MLPIRTLQPLPHGGRAVTKWSNLDEAFEDVTWGICEIVRVLIPKHLLSLQETSILYSKEVNRAIYLQETSIIYPKEVNQSRYLAVNRPVTEGLAHAPEN